MRRVTLDNALRIAYLKMPDLESVAIGVWLGVGGRYEDKSKQGITHFLEHMVFKGSSKRSARQIKEAIESVGGSINGFTSEEFTCYFVKVLGEHLKLAVDVLCDMVLEPLLQKQDIEKEIPVVCEEIKMHLDLPMYFVHELISQMLWPNHPLGVMLTGTVESISSLTKQDMFDYKTKFYVPNNIIIVACGKLNEGEFIDQIREYFSATQTSTIQNYEKVNENKQTAPQIKLQFKKTEQTHFCIGSRSLPREHPDRFSQSLLNIILGANMSSRLFQEIREKRSLAYDIGSNVRKFADTGAFIIHAGVDNKKIDYVIGLIMEQLLKIKRKPVEKKELENAKQFYRGQLLLSLEDSLEYMLWSGEYITAIDKIYKPQEILENVNKVTIEDINRISNEIFRNENLNLAMIGPHKKPDKVRGVFHL